MNKGTFQGMAWIKINEALSNQMGILSKWIERLLTFKLHCHLRSWDYIIFKIKHEGLKHVQIDWSWPIDWKEGFMKATKYWTSIIKSK
jgi:hypothetical protein